MRSVVAVFVAVIVGQLAFAAPGWAQTAQPQQPPPDPWQAPPAGPVYQTPPPGYPPPGYPPPGYPPPGYAAPYAYGPNSQYAYMQYESQRRNSGLAVLIEILVPGVGSLYGDHGIGALITWGLMIAGIVVLVAGLSQWSSDLDTNADGTTHSSSGTNVELAAGLILLLGGRIYGLVDSYQSTEEFNRKLRVRLGLPAGLTMGIGPVGRGTLSVGPHVGFTF